MRHRINDRTQSASLFGQRVFDSRRNLRKLHALERPLVFKAAQSFGQRFWRNVSQARAQLAEKFRAGQQVTQDQCGPFATNDFERALNRAFGLKSDAFPMSQVCALERGHFGFAFRSQFRLRLRWREPEAFVHFT